MSRVFDVENLLRPDSDEQVGQHWTGHTALSNDNDNTEPDDEEGKLVIYDPNESASDQDSCIGSTSLEATTHCDEPVEQTGNQEEEDSRQEFLRIDSGLIECEDFEEVISNSNHFSQEEEDLPTARFATKTAVLPLKVWMFKGSRILARWDDGLYYEGTITDIDELSGHAEIVYEDGSKYWTDFKDLHKQQSGRSIMTESDILCAYCRDGESVEPNQIVLCDVCNQGYHQKCHKPKIPSSLLDTDDPWTCRLCIFALGTNPVGGAEKPNTQAGRDLKRIKNVLPYDLTSLDWDEDHRVNRQKTYCYCGGPGNFSKKMLQCRKCLQWFHEACLQCLNAPLLYGDHFFTFTCQVCGDDHEESCTRIIMKWDDVLALVINNLYVKYGTKYFLVKKDIVPFIKTNSHLIKLEEDISKMKDSELSSRIQNTLFQFRHRFKFDKRGWTLRTSSFKRQIFAPPHAVTSKKCPRILEPTTLTPSMIFPYGACRKGACNFPLPRLSPSPPTKVTHNQRSNSRSPKYLSSLNSNSSESSSNHSHSEQAKKHPLKNRPRSFEELFPVPADLFGKDNPFRDQDDSVSSSSNKNKTCKRQNSLSTPKKKVKKEEQDDQTSYQIVKKSPKGITIKRISC
jgi:polycomb-like protein 2